MAKAATDTTKMFTENTVAVLLMALGSVSISTSQYDLMSALDGEKTASSFQHQFRSVVKKAKDLKTRVDNGEKFTPVAPSGKRSATTAFGNNNIATPPATPKRAKKTAVTATPKPKGKKAKQQSPLSSDSGNSEDYVKTEAPASDDDGGES
ncbi:hypothetical protein DM02DRAFT_669581 [Periconia macrospinosa]|uniref:Uncharacterized protein n=1 Tax=Periconia macrospinosa TaxID=97972 RepID=A0A2V1DZV2_9PLEO|nr:hypothetical protein DM02DRAFT_669581 [Periconia macrospinosa]